MNRNPKKWKYLWLESYDDSMTYDSGTNRWYSSTNFITDSFDVHTIKAAIRHIRKHDEIPVGKQFVLRSRWYHISDKILTKHKKE